MPASLDEPDLLLLTVARPRVVHRDGIRFQGQRYLDLTLAAYVGEPVTIRYDPRDLAEIRVYHKHRFLCRAIAPELADQTISLRELQAARNARRRGLRVDLTERLELAEQFLPREPPPTPAAQRSETPRRVPRLKRCRNE
jgi:putative transposase